MFRHNTKFTKNIQRNVPTYNLFFHDLPQYLPDLTPVFKYLNWIVDLFVIFVMFTIVFSMESDFNECKQKLILSIW